MERAGELNYTLIVSEKRAAAERIARALDDDGTPSKLQEQGVPYFEARKNGKKLLVVPALGHLYTIAPEIKRGFNYPVFDVKWTPAFLFDKRLKYTKRWIEAFSKLSENASEFICGTDYDIEGEVIGYTILKYACGGKEKNAKRMVFSTLIVEDIRRSYNDVSTSINFRLVEAGETRHIIDFLWGINLSRALTLALKNRGKLYARLSAGRVQTPTLKFLVDREKAIQRFVPNSYWRIKTKVKIGNRLYTVKYERSRINREQEAERITKKCSRQRGLINDIAISISKHSPPVPFDLGTLQSESYRLFGYSPSLALRTAERLYIKALISYPRTSSQKMPPTINHRVVLTSLGKLGSYRDLTNKLLVKKKLRPREGNREDTAHPAIYPTGNLPDGRLNSVSWRIFDLIVKRYMAVFWIPAVRESKKVSIKVRGETFYLDGVRTQNEGWLEFYKPYGKMVEVILPPLSIGDEVLFRKIRFEKEFTTPPPRFNPGRLLKLMEEHSIGTKSTRAGIIDTLYERGYIKNERMAVTELGFRVAEILEKYCKGVMSVEFTRILEERMEKIEKGTDTKNDVLNDSIHKLKTILTQFRQSEDQIGLELREAVRKSRMEKLIIGQCPSCKTGSLIVLHSKKTGKRFAGCTNFSEDLCNSAFPLPQPPYKIKLLRKTCRICAWPIIKVSSSGTRFWDLCLNAKCPTKKNQRKS